MGGMEGEEIKHELTAGHVAIETPMDTQVEM